MSDEQHIRELLFRAIDDVNAFQSSSRQLPRAAHSALTGTSAAWDSLALVQFLIAAEDLIEDWCGGRVPISDRTEELEAELRTVQSLGAYIARRVEALDR